MTDRPEREAPTAEEIKGRQALYCLHIAVEEPIARDVSIKVEEWVRAAVADRDIEWCKMLGFCEAGSHGNTPEFMRRELEAYHEEPDTAVAVRAAVEAERELQSKAWESGFRHCLEWYGIWRDGVQTIGAMQRPIKECLPQDGRMEHDLAAIRKGPDE